MCLGLPAQESLIFGFSLSIASTVVLLRALEDGALLTGRTGGIAVCWVLVQDVATILALVIMPILARASSGEVSAFEIAAAVVLTGAQIALFVIFMLVVGRRLLPPLLTFLMKAQLHELFSLGVFAIALGIAYLAHKVFGVSFALGAFFAGLVLNETDLSRRATEDMLPLREAFAVLFFVSVGVLFDPGIFVTHGWAIAAVLAVITIGNGLVSFLITSALRMPVRQRLIVTAGVAQIGEFSFLLTGFALALGLISPEAQALTLAGGLLAIALNPLLFRASEAIARGMYDPVPAKPARRGQLSMPGQPR
jgi:monovalent cation:H+ antiporter-2, CPA2 family